MLLFRFGGLITLFHIYIYVYMYIHIYIYLYYIYIYRCYHGVPRILSPDEDEVTRLLTTHWRTAATAASTAPAAPPPAAPSSPTAAAATADSSRLQEVAEYLVTHRLNINIRQVHSVREEAAARDSTALQGP
jgi:hypothetical protein